MILSIWRYSHLSLAISSCLFILIASITGIILAFEPITEQAHPYHFEATKEQSLAKTIQVLQHRYEEVLSLEKDHNNFVIADVITKEGESKRFYIDPSSGEKVGDIIEKAPVYQFATTLHRSLFLKTSGRVIICIISFFLCLIAITGVLLVIKRQGSTGAFFSKVIKEDKHQYYHVVVGRLSLIPIIIITLTGVYLSLEKFSIIPKEQIQHQTMDSVNAETSKKELADFVIFNNTTLQDLTKLEFPFSEDPEDYFFLKLSQKELIIDQYSGAIRSKIVAPFTALASSFSLTLHTGKGNTFWAIILLISTASILYFMYSGFAMTLQRRRKRSLIPRNFCHKDEANIVILVGSESGNTYASAKLVFDAIKKTGIKVYLSELNALTEYPQLQHLIVFTSTYGQGEAPANGHRFKEQLNKLVFKKEVSYSVVGFGSLAYAEFCRYAEDVQHLLQKHSFFKELLPLVKIHNQSREALLTWAGDWSQKMALPLQITSEKSTNTTKKQQLFSVVYRTELTRDHTFMIRLRPAKKVRFQSGDLLEFLPKEDAVPRLYSIAKIDQDIVLSIKKHDFGVCSTYFSQLNSGDTLVASIQKNADFHLPNHRKPVLMISNGTGIAPFLGMMDARHKHREMHLFWGGRTEDSFKIYNGLVEKALLKKTLSSVQLAYSRVEKKNYVQDLLMSHKELVARVISENGCIMICGSLAMEKGVLKVLHQIAAAASECSPEELKALIKTDCY